ncbi:MAG: uroporphyrinogen-III synthase [Burkholderiales bacterium]|jgi:uroporphyrinogen-III synthase|nr:uroporphyrinogen-III synthase [Burkholderiales bacterium]
MTAVRPLAGRGIVITRPARQAAALAEMISSAGGQPILFPVLEILDTADLAPLIDAVDRLESFDLAIFISPNAALRAMNQIAARRAWPAGLRAAAVGKGSVKELKRFGITEVLAPTRSFDSEALLALPELQQIDGWRVVIFRGDGGRELLGDTLAARGASVEYVECYRRARPRADAAPLLRAWARKEVDAITVTSSEGLRNLFEMVGKLGQSWLRRTPLLVAHPRIAAAARELGCSHVVETAPGDDGLMAALLQLFAAA